MPEYSKLVRGADCSHYQHRPDHSQLQDDGIEFLIIKATQGMSADPDFDWNRGECVKRNMMWLPYPYITPSDNMSTAAFFARVVGGKVPPAFDWEARGVEVSVVEMWKGECENTLGRTGLGYYGKWPPEPATELIGEMLRWLPDYAAKPNMPLWDGSVVPTDWRGEAFIWQNTGNGRLPGINGAIDLNYLSCPLEVFRKWYETGVLTTWAAKDATSAVPQSGPVVASDRVLFLHCSGDDVLGLQRRLAWLGEQIVCDGSFGPQTVRVVEHFQLSHNLDDDGIVGPVTVAALNIAQP